MFFRRCCNSRQEIAVEDAISQYIVNKYLREINPDFSIDALPDMIDCQIAGVKTDHCFDPKIKITAGQIGNLYFDSRESLTPFEQTLAKSKMKYSYYATRLQELLFAGSQIVLCYGGIRKRHSTEDTTPIYQDPLFMAGSAPFLLLAVDEMINRLIQKISRQFPQCVSTNIDIDQISKEELLSLIKVKAKNTIEYLKANANEGDALVAEIIRTAPRPEGMSLEDFNRHGCQILRRDPVNLDLQAPLLPVVAAPAA